MDLPFLFNAPEKPVKRETEKERVRDNQHHHAVFSVIVSCIVRLSWRMEGTTTSAPGGVELAWQIPYLGCPGVAVSRRLYPCLAEVCRGG